MHHDPATWGLGRRAGRLTWDGHDLTELACVFGTPVHVASAARLRARCARFSRAFSRYRGGVQIHFSYKTNAVAGLLRVLHSAGIGAEVVGGYELWLAEKLGVQPTSIVFNGPNKRDEELRRAVELGIGLLVVDGLDELRRLEGIAAQASRSVRIALRICPDISPHGMNASSLTGSRRNQFGFDLRGGEAKEALARTLRSRFLDLAGVMAHVGSGIHDLASFDRMVAALMDFYARAHRAGATPELIDVGGGLGARASREFTTFEMLAYLGLGKMPAEPPLGPDDLIERYADRLCIAVERESARHRLVPPKLVLEPGRVLTSDAQLLLLSVGAVRERPGVGRFALVDGGAMTVSMMFLSEYHGVLLANREASDDGCTSIFGALPSPMDVVYRNLPCPKLVPGDVLAVTDAGAYFTSTATNFGGPRPSVVLLDGDAVHLVRRRETYDDICRAEVFDASDASLALHREHGHSPATAGAP